MSASNNPENHVDYRYLIPFLTGILSLVAQSATLILFLVGTTAFQGRTISVVVAIKFLIEIFSVNSATVYPRVIGLVAAIVYFVCLGLIVKNLCVTIIELPELKKSRFSLHSRRYNYLRLSRLVYECLLTFELVCLYSVLIGLSGGRALPVQTGIVMALSGALFLCRGAALHSLQFGEWHFLETWPDFVKDGVCFLGICFLVFLLQTPAIKEFQAGLLMLLGGNIVTTYSSASTILGSLYLRIICPICFLAALLRLFFLLHDYLPHCMRKQEITTEIRRFFVLVVVLTAVHLIVSVMLAERLNFYVLANWFAGVRYTWLPLSIVSGVILFLEKRYRHIRQIS